MEQLDKKDYEIGFIAKDETGVQKISEVLKRFGADVFFAGPVAKIALAYKINKEPQGFFGFFHFSIEPQRIKEIDHELKVDSSVLRVLIIHPPFLKQKKESRGRMTYAPKPEVSLESKPTSGHLSNEALEKKLEEILQ